MVTAEWCGHEIYLLVLLKPARHGQTICCVQHDNAYWIYISSSYHCVFYLMDIFARNYFNDLVWNDFLKG